MTDIKFGLINVLGAYKALYKELHNLLFPNSGISFEWIDWYFGQIGQKRTRTYGAFYGTQLIGIWSVEPRKMYVGNLLMNVGRCFAVGVHPSFRERGIFVALSNHALEEEKNRSEYDYIVGFPGTTRTVVKGHLKVGWYIVQEVPEYRLARVDIDSVILKHFATPTINFSGKILASQEGMLFGCDEYNELRWLHHPENHYILLTQYSPADEENDFIVLKSYGENCHVLDLCGKPTELLGIARGLCVKHNWTALTVWCADNELYKPEIQEAGFKKTEKAVYLLAHNVRRKNRMELASCHIQNGVEEGY